MPSIPLRAAVSSFPMHICKHYFSFFLLLVDTLLAHNTSIFCLVTEITVANSSIYIKMSSRELNINLLDCFTITFKHLFSEEAKQHQEI